MRILAWNNTPIRIDGLTVTLPYVAGGNLVLLGARDSSGKHYFEVTRRAIAQTSYLRMGLFVRHATTGVFDANYWYRQSAGDTGCYSISGGTVSCPGYAQSGAVRLMCAYDLDAGKIWFGNNGTWVNSGNPATDANPQYSNLAGKAGYPGVWLLYNDSAQFHAEAGDFLYAPPSGFSPPTALPMVGRTAPWVAWSVVDGGPYAIQGTISESGVPRRARIRLHDQQTGRLVREVWSDAAGQYAFTQLNTTPRYVIAFDSTDPYQYPAARDLVIAS